MKDKNSLAHSGDVSIILFLRKNIEGK